MKTSVRLKKYTLALSLIAIVFTAHAQKASFWLETKGPYGQSLWAMLVAEDGAYYAGTGFGAVYRKPAGSERWTRILSGYNTITTIVQDAGGTIYVGDSGSSLSMSEDNGLTWTDIKYDLPTYDLRAVLSDKGGLFVGTNAGVFKRTPGGKAEWTQTGLAEYVFSLMQDHNGFLYAGCSKDIYRSEDNGDTWTKVSSDIGGVFSLAINEAGDIYAGANNGLFVRHAGEEDTWTRLGAELTVEQQVRKVSIVEQEDYARVFISVSGDTYYSDDDVNWSKAFSDFTYMDGRAGVAYDALEGRLVWGTSDGVWTSPLDDLTFSHIGLPQEVTYAMSNHAKLVALADHTLYESPDFGATWSRIFSVGEGNIRSYAERFNGEKYVSAYGGFVGTPWVSAYFYLNEELGWQWMEIGFPSNVTKIREVFVTSRDSVLVGTNGGLYYIDTKYHDDRLLSEIGEHVEIYSLAEDADANIYAGTTSGLHVSYDHGATWSVHLLEGVVVNDFALSGTGEIYMATDEGVYYAADAGSDPELITKGIPGKFYAVVADANGNVYAIGGSVVYQYTDDGKGLTWIEQVPGLKDMTYSSLSIFNNLAFLGTNFGVYRHQPQGVAGIWLSGTDTYTYDGLEHGVTAGTIPEGLTVDIAYGGAAAAPVNAGDYAVTATVSSAGYTGEVYGKVLVEKAPQTITFNAVSDRFNTAGPFDLDATASSGLPVAFSISSGPASVTDKTLTLTGDAGIVVVYADQPGNENYLAAETAERAFEVTPDPVMDLEDPRHRLLSLYPVPAHDRLVIESRQSAMRTLVVRDVMGRVIEKHEFADSVSSHTLNVAGYPAGLLLLNIVLDTNERVIKRAEVIR